MAFDGRTSPPPTRIYQRAGWWTCLRVFVSPGNAGCVEITSLARKLPRFMQPALVDLGDGYRDQLERRGWIRKLDHNIAKIVATAIPDPSQCRPRQATTGFARHVLGEIMLDVVRFKDATKTCFPEATPRYRYPGPLVDWVEDVLAGRAEPVDQPNLGLSGAWFFWGGVTSLFLSLLRYLRLKGSEKSVKILQLIHSEISVGHLKPALQVNEAPPEGFYLTFVDFQPARKSFSDYLNSRRLNTVDARDLKLGIKSLFAATKHIGAMAVAHIQAPDGWGDVARYASNSLFHDLRQTRAFLCLMVFKPERFVAFQTFSRFTYSISCVAPLLGTETVMYMIAASTVNYLRSDYAFLNPDRLLAFSPDHMAYVSPYLATGKVESVGFFVPELFDDEHAKSTIDNLFPDQGKPLITVLDNHYRGNFSRFPASLLLELYQAADTLAAEQDANILLKSKLPENFNLEEFPVHLRSAFKEVLSSLKARKNVRLAFMSEIDAYQAAKYSKVCIGIEFSSATVMGLLAGTPTYAIAPKEDNPYLRDGIFLGAILHTKEELLDRLRACLKGHEDKAMKQAMSATIETFTDPKINNPLKQLTHSTLN